MTGVISWLVFCLLVHHLLTILPNASLPAFWLNDFVWILIQDMIYEIPIGILTQARLINYCVLYDTIYLMATILHHREAFALRTHLRLRGFADQFNFMR